MSFITDKQTLDDLNITGKYKPDSLFNLFNQVHTAGGEKLLAEMFSRPLCDAEAINRRSSIFNYFQRSRLEFPLQRGQFVLMENYLNSATGKNIAVTAISNLRKQVLASAVRDPQYAAVQNGLQATIAVLKSCRTYFNKLNKFNAAPYLEQLKLATGILNDKRLAWLDSEDGTKLPPFLKLNTYDHLLRHVLQKELKALIEIIYFLDVYIAVGKVAKARGFSFAHALPAERNIFIAEGLWHPALDQAVGNMISLRLEKNVLFLTGANMAGKSTLMKSFGIAVYLAHMGFPVAARDLEFSIKDGIYSSINLPDDLKMGYSHFYAEVLRVKNVAQEVSAGKQMVVIFDELFKGTNVKDAYEATLAVTAAFSAYRNCFFIISTHIIEVGEVLKERCDNIQFTYLPTVMDGNKPQYTYLLKEGVTSDRQGMIIIENEGIMELLYTKITFNYSDK